MASFAVISVSQNNVATYTRCGGIFNIHLTTNLPRNLTVKIILKSVQIWQNCGHESVAHFLAPSCTLVLIFTRQVARLQPKIDFVAEIHPNPIGSVLWPPKGTSVGRNGYTGVLTMSLSAIVSKKSHGNKKSLTKRTKKQKQKNDKILAFLASL